MKTAIYIEDGVVQLVLTPESDFEKSAIGSFEGKPAEVQIFSGAFYDCRGGWTRQTSYWGEGMGRTNNEDRSLILRINATKQA